MNQATHKVLPDVAKVGNQPFTITFGTLVPADTLLEAQARNVDKTSANHQDTCIAVPQYSDDFAHRRNRLHIRDSQTPDLSEIEA